MATSNKIADETTSKISRKYKEPEDSKLTDDNIKANLTVFTPDYL